MMYQVAPSHAYLVIWEQRGIFPLHDYSKFTQELTAQSLWMHYFPNAWLVIRTETLPELSEKLRGLLKKEDFLLVMPAFGPADGQLPQDAWTWIERNLKKVRY